MDKEKNYHIDLSSHRAERVGKRDNEEEMAENASASPSAPVVDSDAVDQVRASLCLCSLRLCRPLTL